MYSKDYDCDVRYDLVRPDGTRERIRLGPFFHRPSMVNRVYHRRVLPDFNRWLCERTFADGAVGEIHASLVCSLNDGPEEWLLRPHQDICTAPDHGVVRP
jgi:hypothetical protein